MSGGRRVVWKPAPDVKGIVVRDGPEVSEVRWDDGQVRFVPNYDLSTEGEEETDMTLKTVNQMSGPELAERYNAIARELGLEPVKKFRDRATALRRLAAIQNGIGVVPKPETKPRLAPADVADLVKAFAFRSGSSREKVITSLAESLGRQVAEEALVRAAGSRAELDNALRGIAWRCSDHPTNKRDRMRYRLAKEKTDGKTTYGLHPQE